MESAFFTIWLHAKCYNDQSLLGVFDHFDRHNRGSIPSDSQIIKVCNRVLYLFGFKKRSRIQRHEFTYFVNQFSEDKQLSYFQVAQNILLRDTHRKHFYETKEEFAKSRKTVIPALRRYSSRIQDQTTLKARLLLRAINDFDQLTTSLDVIPDKVSYLIVENEIVELRNDKPTVLFRERPNYLYSYSLDGKINMYDMSRGDVVNIYEFNDQKFLFKYSTSACFRGDPSLGRSVSRVPSYNRLIDNYLIVSDKSSPRRRVTIYNLDNPGEEIGEYLGDFALYNNGVVHISPQVGNKYYNITLSTGEVTTGCPDILLPISRVREGRRAETIGEFTVIDGNYHFTQTAKVLMQVTPGTGELACYYGYFHKASTVRMYKYEESMVTHSHYQNGHVYTYQQETTRGKNTKPAFDPTC